jgi:predicted permease
LENLIISFNAVMPMFLIIVLGFVIKWKNMISLQTQSQLNNLAFRVFIPMMLVNSLYRTDFRHIFQPRLFAFLVLSIIITWILVSALVVKIEKSDFKRGAIIQGICRSNYILFGLAILINLYGADNIGIPSLLTAIVLPLFNAFAVITLEIFRGSGVGVKDMVKEVARNPLIIGVAMGIAISLLQIRLPLFLESAISSLADMAMPLALVAMGASLSFEKTFKDKRNLSLVVIGKLVVIPAVFVPLAILVGFRNMELAALMVVFASPTSVSSYPMADQMNSDSELASAAIILSTLISCFTMFLWIFALKHLGFI